MTQQTNQCPHCQNPLPAGAGFCTNCGQRVAPTAAPQMPVQPPVTRPAQAQPDMKALNYWLGIIGAGVVAATGFVTSFMSYNNVFYDFFCAVRSLGEGAFMMAVAFYMIQRLKK